MPPSNYTINAINLVNFIYISPPSFLSYTLARKRKRNLYLPRTPLLASNSHSFSSLNTGQFVGGPYAFSGKTVGILGLGRIGAAIAKRAEAFGCSINYFSRSEKPNTHYKYYSNVVDLATNCDVLVVACALTQETRYIINRQVIDALGPTGVLINIGRGPHIDEQELVSALVEGRLGGAGLDVFEHEPHVPVELFGLDNVVLLPHVGTGTRETRKDMADLVLGNLEAHVQSKPLLTPVV